jgi:cytochrome P450
MNSEIDLTDLGLFADGPPVDVFRGMRDEAPVHWNESASGTGFWSLTRYADIQAANKDWKTFSSQRRGVTIEEGSAFPAEMQQLAFVMMDPRVTSSTARSCTRSSPRGWSASTSPTCDG